MVATQLKDLTPVGTAMIVVAYMKNSCPCTGMPDRVHVVRPTMNDRIAIAEVHRPSRRSRNSGFSRERGDTCEITPKAGQRDGCRPRDAEEQKCAGRAPGRRRRALKNECRNGGPVSDMVNRAREHGIAATSSRR